MRIGRETLIDPAESPFELAWIYNWNIRIPFVLVFFLTKKSFKFGDLEKGTSVIDSHFASHLSLDKQLAWFSFPRNLYSERELAPFMTRIRDNCAPKNLARRLHSQNEKFTPQMKSSPPKWKVHPQIKSSPQKWKVHPQISRQSDGRHVGGGP